LLVHRTYYVKTERLFPNFSFGQILNGNLLVFRRKATMTSHSMLPTCFILVNTGTQCWGNFFGTLCLNPSARKPRKRIWVMTQLF
ncbi:hypothetical protein TELCIR_23433, partial [Teladorsagia circumcincta]